MSGDVGSASHFNRLMEIARQYRVKVHFLERSVASEVDWDGLYLVTHEFGAGIAIRDGLEPAWRDWVLGHELGHHFGQLNGTLFSPFRAHKVDSSTKERWLGAKRLDPDEEYANQWAVRTLVSEEAWDAAEHEGSTDLHQIVAGLRLPLPAGVAWERWRRRSFTSDSIVMRLSAGTQEILERPITGHGGHQSFFSRLKLRRRTLEIGYYDFSLTRERASVVKGGWLARYRAILDAVAPMVDAASTTRSLFNLRSRNGE